MFRSGALSGPNRGCVPTRETPAGRSSAIQRMGSTFTEAMSTTVAPSLRCGAMSARTCGSVRTGTARSTVGRDAHAARSPHATPRAAACPERSRTSVTTTWKSVSRTSAASCPQRPYPTMPSSGLMSFAAQLLSQLLDELPLLVGQLLRHLDLYLHVLVSLLAVAFEPLSLEPQPGP